LDDPEFSVWRIVLKVRSTLLTKAPPRLRLLGALFGGGEELSALEFASGSALLPDAD
jgi:hypothetical protein